MHAVIDPPLTAAPADISLVRGGLFYRLQQAVGAHPPESVEPRPPQCCVDCHWVAAFAGHHCTAEPGDSPVSLNRLPRVRPAVCAMTPATAKSFAGDVRILKGTRGK